MLAIEYIKTMNKIKILRIEDTQESNNLHPDCHWLDMSWKVKGGTKLHKNLICSCNIDSDWNLSGYAQNIFGENITYQVGNKVYSR